MRRRSVQALVALAFCPALACSSCSPCDEEEVHEVLSPAGQLATSFVRGCGATTKDTTQVTLGRPVVPWGARPVLVLTSRYRVELAWDRETLVIWLPPLQSPQDEFLRLTERDDVHVVYKVDATLRE